MTTQLEEQTAIRKAVAAFLHNPTPENREDLVQAMVLWPLQRREILSRVVLDAMKELKEKIESQNQPPFPMGVVADIHRNGGPPEVMVYTFPSGSPLLCQLDEGVDAEIGDHVVLTSNQSTVLRSLGAYKGDEIARVVRVKADQMEIVLPGQTNDEIVVKSPESLVLHPDLKPGAKVRFSRTMRVATTLEETRQDSTSLALVEQIPDDLDLADLAGLREVKQQLVELEELLLADDAELSFYGLSKKLITLFAGPPGTGKTFASKLLCARLRRRLGQDKVSYIIIQGPELISKYVGQSEANIRAIFSLARAQAENGRLVFLVWDEFESVARSRHSSTDSASSLVNDNILNTLLVELNGLAELRNFFMVAITNRADLIDSALLRAGRIGETITFPRPNWTDTRAIFEVHLQGKHLVEGLETKVAAAQGADRCFSPQELDGPPPVAVARFANGSKEAIRRPALLSGALIAQTCTQAARRAFRRKSLGGEPGIHQSDLEWALEKEFAHYSSKLKRSNLIDYLDWGLDKIVEVVAVEPVTSPAGLYR